MLLSLFAQRLGETSADAIGVLVHTGHSRRHIGIVVDHGALGRQAIGGKGRALLGQPIDGLTGLLCIEAAQFGVLEALGHGRQVLVELLDRIIDAGLFLQLRASTLNHTGAQSRVRHRGAAHHLAHDYFLAGSRSLDGRGQTTAASARNNHVHFFVPGIIARGAQLLRSGRLGRAANHAGKSGATAHESRALQKAATIESFVQVHDCPLSLH